MPKWLRAVRSDAGKTLLRTLLGAGIGTYGGHRLAEGTLLGISERWADESNPTGKLQNQLGRGTSYGLGALLGAVMGAKGKGMFMKPGFRQKTKGMTKSVLTGKPMGLGEIETIVPAQFSPYGTFAAAMSPIGLTAVPHMLDHQKSTLLGAKDYIEQAAGEIRDLKDNPGSSLLEEKAKRIAGGILGDWWSREGKKNVVPAATELAKNLGVAAGGGLAGWYGGGALGRLAGKLIAPDRKKDKFEDRAKSKDRRDMAETIGKMLGSYSMAIGAPILARRYGGGSK